MGVVHKTQLLGCFLQENSLLLYGTNQGLEKQEMSGIWEGAAWSGSGQWRKHAGAD